MPHCVPNKRLTEIIDMIKDHQRDDGPQAEMVLEAWEIKEIVTVLEELQRSRDYLGRTAGSKKLYEAAKAFTKRTEVVRDTLRAENFTVYPGETMDQAIAAARKAQARLEDAVKAYEGIWEARK